MFGCYCSYCSYVLLLWLLLSLYEGETKMKYKNAISSPMYNNQLKSTTLSFGNESTLHTARISVLCESRKWKHSYFRNALKNWILWAFDGFHLFGFKFNVWISNRMRIYERIVLFSPRSELWNGSCSSTWF